MQRLDSAMHTTRSWMIAASLALLALVPLGGSTPFASAGDAKKGEAMLIARARAFLDRRAQIHAGQTVLMISDRSVDDAVRTAFVAAARQSGGTVHEVVLQGEPDVTDGLEIARRMRFKEWFPPWIWKVATESDVVLEMTSLGGSHLGRAPDLGPHTKVVDVPFARREQLADPMARGNYPDEILEELARAVWKQVSGGQHFTLTDPEGTDLSWTLDAAAWATVKNVDPARNATHLSLPPPYRASTPNMHGWLVGSSTHSGPLPRIRLKVEGGRVVGIEEGGHVADYLRKMFALSEALTYPGFPGAGSNWVEETAIGTHPRHARVPGAEHFGWSTQMAAWIGAPRAGVVHLAVGTSNSGRSLAFAHEHGIEVQHLDIELYSPTLTVDGRPLIAKGHLAALDDPDIRRVAAKYGNPEDLLRVTWFPGAH